MTRLSRPIAPAILILPVLFMMFGCSDGSTAPPPTEKGWKQYEVPGAGFSIALPEGWTSVSNYDQDMSDVMTQVRKKLGQDADYAEELVRSASEEGDEFSALDLEPETITYDFIPSVSVSRSEGTTRAVEDQLASDLGDIRAIHKDNLVSQIDAKLIEVPGGYGYSEKFTVSDKLGDGTTGRYVVQRIFRAYDKPRSRLTTRKGSFMLTMTVGASQEQSYADTLEKISKSFGIPREIVLLSHPAVTA